MRPRLRQDDLLTIAHYLGSLVVYTAIAMFVPVLVGVFCGEWRDVFIFAFGTGVMLITGMVLRFCKLRPKKITMRQALVVVGMSWIIVSLLSAIPLQMTGHYRGYIDALFESVSGLTGTGMTLVVNIEHMSNTANTWRFMMHLLGGLAIALAVLSLNLFSRRGTATGSAAAISVYRNETRNVHVLAGLRRATGLVVPILSIGIVGGTVLIAISLALSGLGVGESALEGFWLALSALNTGGFTPHSTSLVFYHSLVVETVMVSVALLGIFGYTTYGALARGRYRELKENIEVRVFCIWTALAAIAMVLTIASGNGERSIDAVMRRGLFTVFSAAGNTGFSVLYPSQFMGVMASGTLLTISMSMVAGGSISSSSGGIKLLRVGVMAKSLVRTIREGLSPDSSVTEEKFHHIGRRTVTPEMTADAFVMALMYMVTIVTGGIVGVLCGFDALTALAQSASVTSNTGLNCGMVMSEIPVVLKMVYILQMLAGRLEFIVLFSSVYIFFTTLIPGQVDLSRLFRISGGDDEHAEDEQGDPEDQGARS